MTGLLATPLGRLRLVGLIEGCSTLLLFFVAMPLKYLAGQGWAVTAVGSVHGVLFVLYCGLILLAWLDRKWGLARPLLLGAAAVVPFGPFLVEPSLRREQADAERMPTETTPTDARV